MGGDRGGAGGGGGEEGVMLGEGEGERGQG